MEQELVWRWKQSKQLDYAEDMKTAQISFSGYTKRQATGAAEDYHHDPPNDGTSPRHLAGNCHALIVIRRGRNRLTAHSRPALPAKPHWFLER